MVKEVKEVDETVGQSSETKTCNSQRRGDVGMITKLGFIPVCKAGSAERCCPCAVTLLVVICLL